MREGGGGFLAVQQLQRAHCWQSPNLPLALMWCMCRRFNRHKLHLITYGFVSLSLMLFGMVFSGFAIFQKNSQIGKVWLAGPTTIVVGLVLCGKVMIDWGPAQLHSDSSSESGDETMPAPEREQAVVKSIDAQYIKQKREDGLLLVNADVDCGEKAPCQTAVTSFDQSTGGGSTGAATICGSRRPSQQSHRPSPSLSMDAVQRLHSSHIQTTADVDASGAHGNCSPIMTRATHVVSFDPRIPSDTPLLSRPRSWSQSAARGTTVSLVYEDDCRCNYSNASNYGSTGRTRRSPQQLVASSSMDVQSPLYQGEMFVLRDRQYLI